ncbi:response regulator transcription factor [uncultured Cedecea sp.]|uniref:response regulator transcription factor n=1 Tax=uncultured Cedecea sp. TaxID=988762 RepID=UPI002613261E|nr:response regulator transcription factor [uncultured Cedecea sp.]
MVSILIVDDHPAICFALKVLLEKEKAFQVNISNGENVLKEIYQYSPKLLILDLELTHGSGLDLLPKIKRHFPALNILIFTSQPASLYALRTLQAGASGYINKNTSLEYVEPLCQLIIKGYQCFPEGVIYRENILQGERSVSDTPLALLSDREITVLNFLKQGKSNMEIAGLLSLSNKTISTYKVRILQKCGCDDLNQLFEMVAEEKCSEEH